MSDSSKPREELRRICVQCSALIDLMDELWPMRPPSMEATDREIGAWIGQRKMIETLKLWREEAMKGPEVIPQILGNYLATHGNRAQGSDGSGDG